MNPEDLFEEGYKLYSEAVSPADLEKARELLGKAATEGHALAQDVLGNMYEDGDGAEKDIHTAADLYFRSAEQGCSAGMFDLGMLCLDGRGVPKDEFRAFSLIPSNSSLVIPTDSQKYAVSNPFTALGTTIKSYTTSLYTSNSPFLSYTNPLAGYIVIFLNACRSAITAYFLLNICNTANRPTNNIPTAINIALITLDLFENLSVI